MKRGVMKKREFIEVLSTTPTPVRSRIRPQTLTMTSASVAWNRAAITAAGVSRSRSSTTPRTTSVVRTTRTSPVSSRRVA